MSIYGHMLESSYMEDSSFNSLLESIELDSQYIQEISKEDIKNVGKKIEAGIRKAIDKLIVLISKVMFYCREAIKKFKEKHKKLDNIEVPEKIIKSLSVDKATLYMYTTQGKIDSISQNRA